MVNSQKFWGWVLWVLVGSPPWGGGRKKGVGGVFVYFSIIASILTSSHVHSPSFTVFSMKSSGSLYVPFSATPPNWGS